MIVGIALALITLAVAAVLHHWLLLQVSPDPGRIPAVRGWLPYVGCAFDFAANPRMFLENLRKQHGDTFAVYVFGVRMLYTFSPQGVSSLYRLREKDASFTQATKGLLSLKLPAEVLAEDSLVKFHRGLKPRLLPFYVRYALDAVNLGLQDMAPQGSFSIFPTVKMLVHRVGLACWIGPVANQQRFFQRLVDAYEQLDPEGGFSNLNNLVETQVTGKYKERRALDRLTALVREMKTVVDANAPRVVEMSISDEDDNGIRDNLSNLYDLHSDQPAAVQDRLVALDVFHFILASQANLYAGISWCLIHLLTEDPKHLKAVLRDIEAAQSKYGGQGVEFLSDLETLDGMIYLEAVIYETLRLVQQSITLRKVMAPCTLSTERGEIALNPPFYLATLLSVTNMDEKHLDQHIPDLHKFRPERLLNADGTGPVALRLSGKAAEGTETLTSTFGHFSHACPGRRLAVAVSKIVLTRILQSWQLTPRFTHATVPPTSVGALARVAEPCIVDYQTRA